LWCGECTFSTSEKVLKIFFLMVNDSDPVRRDWQVASLLLLLLPSPLRSLALLALLKD